MLDGEVLSDTEVFCPQGIHFRPPDGAEGVAVPILGDPDHQVALCVASREWRPKSSCQHPGEGGLYGPEGWFLFRAHGNVLCLGGGAGRDGDDPDDAQTKPSLRLHPDGTVEVLQKSGATTITVTPEGAVIIESDDIRFGSASPGDRPALASEVESKLSDLKTALLAHTHASNGTTPVFTTPPAIAPDGWSSGIASSVVRAD